MDLRNRHTELLIDLLEGCLEEERYEVLKYTDSKKHFCTTDECLSIKKGSEYFTITINREMSYRNPRDGRQMNASDTFESLREEKLTK